MSVATKGGEVTRSHGASDTNCVAADGWSGHRARGSCSSAGHMCGDEPMTAAAGKQGKVIDAPNDTWDKPGGMRIHF